MVSGDKKPLEITHEKMMKLLDWSYERVLNGLPGERSIDDLVNDYLSKYDSGTAIDRFIKFQTAKAATSGFFTGFGGIITMPVTIPANISSVILFQMRMVAVIAKIRGYDLNSDQVQTFVYATLAGTSVTEIMKKTGIVIGEKMFIGVVKKIPGNVLAKINKTVGFRLVTKFGAKGAINIGKMVPVVGALIGGTVDIVGTKVIAQLAKSTFAEVGIDIGDGTIIEKKDIFDVE